MKHELTIVHRVCPVLSNTAYGYADKFSMVKACASSTYEALRFYLNFCVENARVNN